MPFIDFITGKKIKIWEGVTASLYHSNKITFGHITLLKSAEVPEHQHMHEQWTHVISGELLFSINGEEKLLSAGMAAFIPSNTAHAARAISECKVIDCFLPVREDFVELEKQLL